MGTGIDSLGVRIRTAEQRLDESAQTTVRRACELGRLLAEAKASIEHGGWEAWCQELFEGRRCQSWIQNVMKIARQCQENPALLELPSLRAITAVGKKERSTNRKDKPSNAQRAVHLDAAEHMAENVQQDSTSMPESMPEQSSGQADPLAVAETEADNETVAAIAMRIIKDFKRLRAKNDPVVEAAVDEIRDVVGASSTVVESAFDAELAPVTLKKFKYTADEAVAVVEQIAANLRPGQKLSFKNQMARRWTSVSVLKTASKPRDYLPGLPQTEAAILILNRELRYRFAQLSKIDGLSLRRLALSADFEATLKLVHEVIDKTRTQILSRINQRSLFESDKQRDAG